MSERRVGPDLARHRPALVGREREFATIWARFEAASGGQVTVVLVAGEPGIGKTRLLDEVVARAAATGAIVLRGGASEAAGMPPYLPFLEALGRYIRAADPAQLREQTGPAATTLATIFPELAARLGELPPGYPLPPEQARLRLYEAVGAFLAAIAATSREASREDAPLVLAFDDLQWADSASLDLLVHLARHQPDTPLLVLGAYRAGEVAQNPVLERALAELNRLRALTTVTAGPLAAGEVGDLAAGYLDGPLEPDTARLLHAQSEGNPFFAEELLRGWLETGELTETGGRWALADRLGHTGDTLPSTIVGAVRQRLARLAPEVVEQLRTAAIVGRTFDVTLLAEVAGQEADAVEARLLAAARAGLVHPDREGAFTFGHDKIRECLYEEVTPLRRRRLHGFIGRALEQQRRRGGRGGARQLAELAFHFTRSGDRERGAAYARQAAERALQTYAPAEALAHYRAALDLLDPGDSRRGELLLGLGAAAILAGAEDEAAGAFEAARSWFLAAGDPVAAGRAAHGLSRARWRQQALPETLAALETALRLIGDRPVAARVESLVDLANLLVMALGRQEEGIAHGREALELARRLGDARLEATAGRTVGNLLVRGNDIPAGLPLLERALALAEAVDDPAEAAECCSCLAHAYAWKGQMRRFFELTERRIAYARRCNDLYQLRHAYTWAIARPMFEGRWADVEAMLARAQAVVERLASPEPLAFLYNIRGGLAFFQGRYAEAEELFTRSISLFRPMGPGVLVWFLGPLALVQLARGKRQEALATMDEAERVVAANQPGTMATGDALVYLAMGAVALGDRERAARYYPQLLPFQGLCIDVLVDRVLGELETLLGDWLAAEAHLAAAEAAARREDLTPELARTLEGRANLELVRGGAAGSVRARDLLGQALALYERFGMAGDAGRVRDRLDNLSPQPEPRERRTQPALPAGLSPREVEVLRLVAAGKSNRQIAADLSISEKTVINHLTSIFNKTTTDNRAGAAAFAIRHGLA